MPPAALCLISTIETFPLTTQFNNLAISLCECLLTGNMDKKAKAYFSKAAFVVAKISVVMYSCLIFKNDSLLEFQSNQKTHKTDIDMECKH